MISRFPDPALNAAAVQRANINYFCNAALSIPHVPPVVSPGAGQAVKTSPKRRIHEALRDAGWNIDKLIAPTDLGVPAFNIGSKIFATGDFNNGLGLMINGVQYVYVLATHYRFDDKAKRYCIGLRYVFYDVFGLDDDDLEEFGATEDSDLAIRAPFVGITAWWQLQHQHGYPPLVTRIVVERTFEAPAW